MKKLTGLLLAVAVLGLCSCGRQTGWLIKPVPTDERLTETVVQSDEGWFISDKIAVVDVDEVLLNARRGGLFGSDENPVSLFIEKMDKAQADDDVKAVILRINSPGGSVTASDIMYHRLMKFRAEKRAPVVAVIEDVGASGAYYLACGSDKIVAHPTSITGSIGVIVQAFSISGAMKKLSIDARAVTSGKHKDLASPFKPFDEADMQILQKIVDDFYGRFVDVVVAGRPALTREKILTLADGRVYTGTQALADGLVDQLGYLGDAVDAAKGASGSKQVKVVIYHRPLGYKANLYSSADNVPTQFNLVNVSVPDLMSLERPEFLYLWTGKSAGQ